MEVAVSPQDREAKTSPRSSASRRSFVERALQRETDEKVNTLESELTSLREKYEKSTYELDSAYNKINELEANLNSVKSALSEAQESLKLHQNNAENFRLQRDSALEIRDSLTNMIETRDTEINSLKVSIENLQQSLQSAVNSKCDMLFKNKDVHSKSITDTYKDIHSGQEKIGQNNQIEILKSELHRYMTDFQTVQGNTASLKINFERQLAKKNDELNMLNIKISKLEEIKENLNNRVNSLNKKISEQSEKEQKSSEEYKNEILTKNNIIELYKNNQEDSNMKNEELTQFLSELKQLLHQSEEKNKELRYVFEKNQLEQKEIVEKKDEEIAALKRELENANDLLQMTDGDFSSCLENLSPSAAIASKFIKSRMSLTQAYDQLVKLSDELELEQNEKKRLSNALTSILTELEERSPYIEQQQQQYAKVLEMKEALNEQLQSLIAEQKQLREENSEVVKLSARFKKENAQMKTENDDLSRQICYLLREIETIKGTTPFPFNDMSSSKSFNMNSSDVISEKVVTFRDINELQANNQKLLKLVRNLSEKREEAEISKDQSEQMDSEEIGPKMDSLKNRITELSEAQDRQVKMINGLVRQRDMYKKMCDDRDLSMSIDKHNDSVDFNTTTRSESMKHLSEKSQYFEILESQLANLKKELALENDKYKVFVEKSKSNEVKLVEMHDAMHKQFNELHSKYVKCLSSSESLSEKCKMMQIELSSSNRQIASLNEKINSYSTLIGKQESYGKKLNDELSSSRKKLVHTESILNALRLEHTKLINSSGNINIHETSENKANCSSALKNIESIKNSIENDGNESIVKLQNALEEANRTCSTLRCMLQLEQNKYRDLTEHLKEEINQCKLKMNFEQDVMQNLKDELTSMKQELKMKNNLIKDLNNGFSNAESKSTGVYSDTMLGNLSVEHSDDVAVLKQQLEISRQHLEKYCNIYECSEKDLKTLNEAFENYKKETEIKLHDSLIRENLLTDSCKNLDRKISTCSKEILSLQNKLNSLESNLAEKNESLEKALLDVAKLSNSVQIAEDKYAHEIVLHSNDIQALAQFKHHLLEANQKVNNLEYTKTELECSLRENIESWKQCEKMLINENAETKEQLRDLNDQNTILHNQIQTLSAKLTAFNTSRAADISADASMSDSMMHVSDSDESKSSEQLLQIIKYLRKEKDILMTKFEIMQTENQRIKSQLESTETQLDDVKLTSKDNSPQIVSEKHSGVIRKVETLNAMSDCFVDLRKERDLLLGKVREMTDNYNKLSETIIPIQQNNCELLARINLLQTENDNLNKEIIKWKNRANALIEKDDSESSDDLKKLHSEQENLLKKLSAEKINVKSLTETISKQRIEMNQLKNQTDNISKQYNVINENYKKTLNELVNLKKDLDKTNQELVETKSNLAEKVKEIAEMNVTMNQKDEAITDIRNKEAQVRKIGKRFKMQYEELLKTVDEEKKKSATLVSEAAVSSENHLETCKIFEQKTIDLERNHEEKLNDLKTQISSCSDENKSLQREIDSLKNSNQEKDEKLRMWHKQAKTKISSLSEAKENLIKELNETKNKLETTEQSKDENEARLSLLKSQYDGRLAKLDKEKTLALQEKQNEIVQLNKQIESLMQKINLMQKKLDGHQTPKPSTSSNQGEKCSSETPTANIKPMAGVVSQRDPNRRTSGDTPLASIRPMASHTGVRTAAVLPTTAQMPTFLIPIQAPHTTGSGSSDMLSSPSSSHGTEYMPSSSSTSNRLHPQHPRHVTLPPPESTQDIDTEISVGSEISNVGSNNAAVPQSVSPQVVALVLPRMENNTSEMQTSHIHQQASSSSSNNSSSTVTTSHGPTTGNSGVGNKNDMHRGFKRPQIVSPQPQSKTILKRPKIQAFQRAAENEADYQIPTSSQRDQEDEMMNFGDSEDEDNYQDPVYEIDDDENDLDDKERTTAEIGNATDSHMSEEQEATGSNNEVDLVDESSQEVRSSHREDNTVRCDNVLVEGQDATLVTPAHEQQIETISSGSGIASVSAVGSYENVDERIIPTAPNIFVPPRSDSESGNARNAEDHPSQIMSRSHPTLELTSEAEVGDSSSSVNVDDELPTVSSQSTTSTFSPQVEEGREAEAISTANNAGPRGPWRRGMKNMKGSNSPQINRNTDQHQRPSPIVWNSDGNLRRGSFLQQRGMQRGLRHPPRRPNYFKRY